MKIAIVAGGTGGHIYPGIAVAQEIKFRFPNAEIIFLGSEEGMEKDLIPRYGFNLRLIKSRALLRKISYQSLSAPVVSIFGFFQAISLLHNFKPNCLFSAGSYVSLPAVLAARILSIPIYLHEQNVLPGITNRFCFKLAKKVFLSFEESKRFAKGEVLGNPLRQEILMVDREICRRKLKINPHKKAILILGGSQGAQKINEVVLSSLEKFPGQEYEILHVIGNRDFGWASRYYEGKNYSFYHPFSYLYNIEEALAAADLVVSRAGATAIAECLSRELPMILVPFPYSAEGHQDLNAKVIENAGGAMVIRNQDFTVEKFLFLLQDKSINWEQMSKNCKNLAKPNAAAEIVCSICNG